MLRVDADGVGVLPLGADRVVDVLFDDRRIWSFWVRRDTTRSRVLGRSIAWPSAGAIDAVTGGAAPQTGRRGFSEPGGGSFRTAQKTPRSWIASRKSLKATGFTTYAFAPRL